MIERLHTPCDTDEAKRELLRAAIATHRDDAHGDVFELAVSIRAALPEGLAADDFDGDNILELLEV